MDTRVDARRTVVREERRDNDFEGVVVLNKRCQRDFRIGCLFVSCHAKEPRRFSFLFRLPNFFTIKTVANLESFLSSHEVFVPNQTALLWSKITHKYSELDRCITSCCKNKTEENSHCQSRPRDFNG
jgi:hypothetical protein